MPVRALVCGAGYRTTLFLRQIALRAGEPAPVEVVGLVSEDAAITGHDVHGIRVVGTCRDLPALVARHRIGILYLVEPVGGADIEEIFRSLRTAGVRLIRWDIVESDWTPGPDA